MKTIHSDQQWQSLCADVAKSPQKPLVVVIGPTASGKTAFALELAHYFAKHGNKHAEIINADSRQVYSMMDIGTAKVTIEEMEGIPHHLLSELQPSEEITASWFQKRAEECIQQIHARGNVPILVGGSMLYVSAVIDGLSFAPAVEPALRSRLEDEYDKDQGVSLYQQLQKQDPETAAAFHSNNKPYVIRAMEILESEHIPASHFKQREASPYDLLIFGMLWPREELVERINTRTRALLDAGWIEEVQSLMKAGYASDAPAMKSHGYREVMNFLESGGTDLDALAEEIAIKTRQYAKRQMTWWKSDPRIVWVDGREVGL